MSIVFVHLPGLNPAEAEDLIRDLLVKHAIEVGGADRSCWVTDTEAAITPHLDQKYPPRRTEGRPLNPEGFTAMERSQRRAELIQRVQAIARRTVAGVEFEDYFTPRGGKNHRGG